MIHSILPKPREIQVEEGFYQGDPERTEQICDDSLETEGYRLKIGAQAIEMRAKTQAGFYYAEQTLRQLQRQNGGKLPLCEIVDAPVFAHRGFMLDCVRHFFPVTDLKRLIEAAARMKLNRFHWHLTDDQGWRIEIRRYPDLTGKGAWRHFNKQDTICTGRARRELNDDFLLPEKRLRTEGADTLYGGCYTQRDIREIVSYAAARGIDVIPEIDMPGHFLQAIEHYPWLTCFRPETWSEQAFSSPLCLGRDDVLRFCEEIWEEVFELFPYEYVHIGGDEADRTAWKSCPRCRHLARELGGVDQVQCYLVEHAEKFLAEHGRTMIGWDEILKNNLRSTSTVISYRGQRGGIEAANRGYDVVMSPGEILYFDWYQADPHTQPRAMGGFSPIRKMYGFHPVPDTPAKAADNESIIRGEFVSPDSVEYIYDGGKEHVIGVQGCTWTEFIETEKHLEYMIFPRLLAVSELAWTPRERREWNDFRRRINVHVSLLHARGINAFPLSDDVVITAQMLSEGKKARVTLDTEKYPAEVRYTLDGTAPVPGSDLYDGPFVVKAGTTVRAALFVAGRMEGTMTELYVDARRNVDNYYTYLNTPEVYASTDR